MGRIMKPSRSQYLFANDWPLFAYYSLAAILGVVVVVVVCQPSRAIFSDGLYLSMFVVSLLVAPVLGFLVSLPFVWIIIGPLYRFRGTLNGAPFSVGDRVRILAGPHSGRVVRVYEVWSERCQVRVELDEQAKKEFTDAFSYTQICRESAA